MKKVNQDIKKREESILIQDKLINILKGLIPYIVIIFVVAIIRTFFITPVKVQGTSMDPYLKHGEILLLNKTNSDFERFDIIVADASDLMIIKRIIGLPGESIEYKNCKLYIDGKEKKDFVTECITNDFSLEDLYGYVVIPEDYYFVMGDNRLDSSDSRDDRIGLIKKDQIRGEAVFRFTPFSRFGTLKK